jgi:hypothetical protein
LILKTQDDVGVTFINQVVSRGVWNDVANLTLAVYNFSPEGDKIAADPVIVGRLRMDKQCAIQLAQAMAEIIMIYDRMEQEPDALKADGIMPKAAEIN